MKPVPQFRGPPATCGAGNVLHHDEPGQVCVLGAQSIAHPAPHRGTAGQVEPVFIWQTPPTWFNPLDQQERITAMSSTQVAMCGSQSETQIPLWPCCFHFALRGQERCSPFAHGRDHWLEAGWQRLAGQSVELGFGVERIEMAGPSFHEEKDHALGRRAKCLAMGRVEAG